MQQRINKAITTLKLPSWLADTFSTEDLKRRIQYALILLTMGGKIVEYRTLLTSFEGYCLFYRFYCFKGALDQLILISI